MYVLIIPLKILIINQIMLFGNLISPYISKFHEYFYIRIERNSYAFILVGKYEMILKYKCVKLLKDLCEDIVE